MRLFVSFAVLGIMVSASVPAMAQQTTTTPQTGYVAQQPIYTMPVYNSSSTNYYQPGTNGTPVYNNSPSAQPFAMNQMVAGQNAPSYNYNRNKSYGNFGSDPLANMDLSSMTPEQARLVRAQRNARAQQAQADYLASLQGQQPPGGMVNNANPYTQAGQMYNPFAAPEKEKPKQRRVVYNEKNNPLVTPPRLFNPDQ